jgi:hypothetical protein
MKVCCRCKIGRDESEFAKNHRAADGLNYHCNVCRASWLRSVYPIKRELVQATNRRWREKNPELAALIHKKATDKYALNNIKIRKANVAVREAKKKGLLLAQPCECCFKFSGQVVAAQAHHDDYSKPLDVRWLCSRHHKGWHRLFVAEGSQ